MYTVGLFSAIISALASSTAAVPVEASAAILLSSKDLSVQNYYGSPLPPWHSGSKPGWYYGPHPDKSPVTPALTPKNCRWLTQYPQVIHCPYSHSRPSHSSPYSTSASHHYAPHHPSHYPPSPPPPHTTETYTTGTSHSNPSPSSQAPETDTVPTSTYIVPIYSNSLEEAASTSSYAPLPPPSPPSNGYHSTFYNITAAVQADDYITFGMVETTDDCKAMCDSVKGCGFVNTYHDVHGKDGKPFLSCSLFMLCHTPEDADNRGGQFQSDGTTNFITDSDGWCKKY